VKAGGARVGNGKALGLHGGGVKAEEFRFEEGKLRHRLKVPDRTEIAL
jgi:hypothetical protein